MSESSRSAIQFPSVEIREDAVERIDHCLTNESGGAIIHQAASMDSPYDLTVTASKVTSHSKERLFLSGVFTYKPSADSLDVAGIRERFASELQSANLRKLGAKQTFTSEKKTDVNVSIAHPTNVSAVSWFAPEKEKPQLFVANSRASGGKIKPLIAPEYSPEVLAQNIQMYMRILAMSHAVIDPRGLPPRYIVDFIEAIQPVRSATKRQRSPEPEKPKSEPTSKKNEAKVVEEPDQFVPQLPNPNARFEQVHGLDPEAKVRIMMRISTFHTPELADQYGVRAGGGILFNGPGGLGKTMAATAISNEIGGKLWMINTPDIVTKWLGGSAGNVSDVFDKAIEYSQKQPLCILLDEVDGIAGMVKNNTHSEIVGVIAELKKKLGYIAEKAPNILTMMTTNHVGKLDSALIRAGRMDLIVNMKAPNEDARTNILLDQLDLFPAIDGKPLFEDTISLSLLDAAGKSHGMTGADLGLIIKQCRAKKFYQHHTTGVFPGPITYEDIAAEIEYRRHNNEHGLAQGEDTDEDNGFTSQATE